MTHSVSRAIIEGLPAVLDEISQNEVELLGEHQSHPQSALNHDAGITDAIDGHGTERQGDDMPNSTPLNQFVNKLYGGVTDNLDARIVKNAPGLNDHFVVAHNHPLLGEMNARSAGLLKESSLAEIEAEERGA
jgi:hypothetical protein